MDENNKFDKAVESYEKGFDKAANALGKVSSGATHLFNGCVLIFANLFFMAFCAWGAYAASVSWKLETTGEVTTGTVLRLEESKTSEGYCCVYTPVIEYQVNGQMYSFENDNASNQPDYKLGGEVRVRYDPADPSTAQIDNPFERWVFPAIIIPTMIFTALVVNFFSIRTWRRGESLMYHW